MKGINFIILSFFIFQLGFSQTEKLLQGKVSENGIGIERVDVINYTTQKSTVTNAYGVFSILAKPTDILLFYHKNYTVRKIVLSGNEFNPDSFIVELTQKSVEIEEVIVDENSNRMGLKLTPAEIEQMKIQKKAAEAQVLGVNDGTITNGMDLKAIGKLAYKAGKGIFSKKKNGFEPQKVEFQKYVAANIREDYFTKTLKLQQSEIPLFLSFCNEDPGSKAVSEHPNVLAVMDFLSLKNVEFQKMLTLVK